jgi:hypothetical protein
VDNLISEEEEEEEESIKGVFRCIQANEIDLPNFLCWVVIGRFHFLCGVGFGVGRENGEGWMCG